MKPEVLSDRRKWMGDRSSLFLTGWDEQEFGYELCRQRVGQPGPEVQPLICAARMMTFGERLADMRDEIDPGRISHAQIGMTIDMDDVEWPRSPIVSIKQQLQDGALQKKCAQPVRQRKPTPRPCLAMLCASMIDLLLRRNRARLSPEEEDEPIRRHAKRVSPDSPARRREQEGSASARPQTPNAASSSGDSASSASATSMSRRMEAGRSRCAAPVAPALERTACHCSVGGCSPSSDRRAARMSSIGTGRGRRAVCEGMAAL